jgi:hypothetical protein
MDHVIEYILDYMRMDVDTFRSEYEGVEYGHTMMNCPTYKLISAYCRAISALDIDGNYGRYSKPEYYLKDGSL